MNPSNISILESKNEKIKPLKGSWSHRNIRIKKTSYKIEVECIIVLGVFLRIEKSQQKKNEAEMWYRYWSWMQKHFRSVFCVCLCIVLKTGDGFFSKEQKNVHFGLIFGDLPVVVLDKHRLKNLFIWNDDIWCCNLIDSIRMNLYYKGLPRRMWIFE